MGWVVRLIGFTCRLEVLHGGEILDDFRRHRKSAVFSLWHNRAFYGAYHIRRRFLRHGYPITILASQSRDGDLATRLADLWGIDTVRGSASRGGTAGLRRMYRAITKGGSSVVTLPDGPLGPPYRSKPGTVVLAQMAGVPVVPFAWAARSAWILKSWDRMIIPRPFTRVALAVGEPIEVPPDLSDAEMEERRRTLDEALDSLVQEVESHLGVRGPELPWERWGLEGPSSPPGAGP